MDGFWRIDVLYGLFDDPGRARPGARSARFRIDLGARALAHTEHAQNTAGRRRRAREALLRRDGPVRHIDGGSDGDQDVEGRDRRLVWSTSETRSRPRNSSLLSITSRAGGSYSASAAAGTKTKSRATGRSSKADSKKCANRSRR